MKYKQSYIYKKSTTQFSPKKKKKAAIMHCKQQYYFEFFQASKLLHLEHEFHI